jgi:hypothetical protein
MGRRSRQISDSNGCMAGRRDFVPMKRDGVHYVDDRYAIKSGLGQRCRTRTWQQEPLMIILMAHTLLNCGFVSVFYALASVLCVLTISMQQQVAADSKLWKRAVRVEGL